MAMQQIVPVIIMLQGDGVATTFTLALSNVYQIGDTGSVSFATTGVLPSGILIRNPPVPVLSSTIDVNGNITFEFANSWTELLSFEVDLLYDSGVAISTTPNLSQTVSGVVPSVPVDAANARSIFTFSASTGAKPVLVVARQPILSIQPIMGIQPTMGIDVFNFLLRKMSLIGNGAAIFYELILNGDLTGAVFNPADPNSNMCYDVAATAISGGRVVDSGFLTLTPLTPEYLLFVQASNSPPSADTYTLVVTPMGSRPVPVSGVLRWTEEVQYL